MTIHIRRYAAGAALAAASILASAGPAWACNDGLPHEGCPPVTTTTTVPKSTATVQTYPAPTPSTTTSTTSTSTTSTTAAPTTTTTAPKTGLPVTGGDEAELAIAAVAVIAAGAFMVRRARA